MVRAVSESTFQPRIAFKTRYGMTENPFAKVGGTAIHDGEHLHTFLQVGETVTT